MTGTDLTKIDGIDVMTATNILSEAGWDMSKWEDEHHFVSWLRLCPDNRISGNKIIGKGRLPTNNRASLALKMAGVTRETADVDAGKIVRDPKTGEPTGVLKDAAGQSMGSAQNVGTAIFTTYLLPFEVTSVLILIAIIGAIVLARKELD